MGREDRDRARVRRPARAPKSTRRVTGRTSSLDSDYGERGERGDRVRARVGDAGRRTVELLGVASTRRAAILAVVV
ncbi:MAG: hypothetical protein J2O49_02410, partial [Sciscionella sp.]|nr:hypothetical protein [Sciscionella sp.]